MSKSVVIENAVKYYGDFKALKGISLNIEPGEFFTLLGPSGCGKTTLLRMIAGFNSIDEGIIRIDGKVINDVPAFKRDIGMVFQNYAIFPHMTVAENVAYGLKAKKVPKSEIASRVEEALREVQIAEMKDRKPSNLSGGQQQRVALARAFVIEPGVLLMDEPLSNLDAKLRIQMRTVVKKLQRRLGITTIYVTHDQEEALAVSDRIAVMKHGEVTQVGTPKEIYNHPANKFVAGFIGVSNFIECNCESHSGNEASIHITENCILNKKLKMVYNGKVYVSVRPEQIFFSDAGIDGRILFSTFLGDFVMYEVQLPGGQVIQVNEYTKDTADIRPDGQEIHMKLNKDRVGIYTEEGELLSVWDTT